MTQINLLPWREQLRKTKKIYFSILLGSCIFLSLIIILAVHLYFSKMITMQDERNVFLQAEINKEKLSLEALNKSMKEYESIESDIRFGIKLRNDSYQAVLFLKELANIVPSSISLSRIVRQGDDFVLDGIAESNAQITFFMQDIAESAIFDRPVLSEISKDEKGYKKSVGAFQIRVHQRG